jgi:biopolymer transport protein ExbD
MKRRNRRQGPDIDLTPLLDVIFIVLMVVMCQQSLTSNAEKEALTELENNMEVTQAENEIMKTQLESYETEDQLVAFITLNADYEKNDPKTRHIRLAYNDETVIEDIVITPDTQVQAYDQFVSEISAFVESKEGMPVLLTLQDEGILYRDHVRLEKEIAQLQETYSNLYLTGQE